MPRASQHPKEASFNFRVDLKLKADFQTATEAEVMRWIDDVSDTKGWTA